MPKAVTEITLVAENEITEAEAETIREQLSNDDSLLDVEGTIKQQVRDTIINEGDTVQEFEVNVRVEE
jgi:hypothetical protein